MKTKITAVLVSAILLNSCKNESSSVGKSTINSAETKEMDASASVAPENMGAEFVQKYISQYTIDTSNYILNKKLIKKASIDGNVKDIQEAVKTTERIAEKYKGIIIHTESSSNITKDKKITINSDSSLHVFASEMFGNATIRVPHEHLLDALADLDQVFINIKTRQINTEDVTAKYIENQLRSAGAQRRVKRLEGSAAINSQNNSVDAERYAAEEEEKFITHKMDIFRIEDEIQYSEIKVFFNQNEKVFKEKVSNSTLSKYNVNIFYTIWNNIITSGRIVLRAFTFLFYLWPLFLIGGIVVWYSRRS
jgi:hypothetical protein